MPNCCRLEYERQKREKYLQRKVQETLSLAVPEEPTAEKACVHGTYPLSEEELKAQSRQYQEKLRLNRILQVRAQEMLFASKRIADFRDRKTNDSKMIINHLKEVWSEDQRRRIASLEKEFANACHNIGLSHNAAVLVERNKVAKGRLMARQAEESRYWKTLRFEEAMQKEREQKVERERGESASTMRRKIVESVSSIERSCARRCNHGAKPKPREKPAFGCSQTVNLPVTQDVTREKVYTKLAGFPIDFRNTYLHSRFDVLQDRTNRPSSAVVNCPEQGVVDGWRAADTQRESNRCERARQIELERLYNERKLERGSAAAAKLLSDQRIALLEQEVEGALREEEREQDRLDGVVSLTGSAFFKRPTSAAQQRRPTCTKHKISNPLSRPGLPHTSLTCPRCRSFVELTPLPPNPLPPSALPPKPVEKEPTPELTINCELGGETGYNILVCPGKSIEHKWECSECSVTPGSPENKQERSLENQTVNSGIKREDRSLEDHCVANSEKQDPLNIDIQGTKLQLVDLASYRPQRGALLQKETKREMSGQFVSTHKSANGSLMNSSQQQSACDGTGLIPELGVTKSPTHFPIQTKRKGMSPIMASQCVHVELNTARSEEGSVMKQQRVRSPNKCPMPEQNVDGGKTGKQQLHVSEGAVEDISAPTKKCRSPREGERDSKSWAKNLVHKLASPCKDRYHMGLVRDAGEVEKEVEQFYKGTFHHSIPSFPQRRPISVRSVSVTHENRESQRSQLANGEIQRFQRDSSSMSRPPFLSSGTIGYKKVLTGALIPRTSKPTCEREGCKETPTEEKISLIRSVQENFKALIKNQREPNFNMIVNENLEENEHAFLPRKTKSSYGVRSSFGASSKGMETNKSWAHPLRPHTRPLISQEQRKALKFFNGAKWPTWGDEPKDDRALWNDSAPKGVGKDHSAAPRNINKDHIRSRFEKGYRHSCSCPDGKLISETSKLKEDNTWKGKGPDQRQATRIQEPKLRQKAVWKSYIVQKKQNSRKNSDSISTALSEPSTPSAQFESVIRPRATSRPHTAQHEGDFQTKARMKQPGVNPNARNCHPPATSVRSLPSSLRSRNGRDKSVLRSLKYSQGDYNVGIEVEAMENISTKIKSLPNRFHSPVSQVPQDASLLRRNWKSLNSKKTNCSPTAFSRRREKPQNLGEIRSSCEGVTLLLNENLAEKEESTRGLSSKSSASSVVDTLATAWKTRKFQGDHYVRAMMNLQAKEIPNGSTSSGISKTLLDQINNSKPWLSKSPSKHRRPDREATDVFLDNRGRQNQRNDTANHKSPNMTRSRNKPWLTNSPSKRSSPHQIGEDQYNRGKNHRIGSSANPKTLSNNSPLNRQSVRNPEASKSSPSKSRVCKKLESTKDPWEGQSLDFVLGSLAEQVKVLNERLRSATVSSPASSSASSPSREIRVNKDKQTKGQPENLFEDHNSSPPASSVASSPERHSQQTNPPSPAYISREHAAGNVQKDAANGPAARRTYMDELKMLLKEISSDNPSPTRSSPASQRVEGENIPHKYFQDIVAIIKPELLPSMNKSCGLVLQTKASLAEFEPDHFESSTSTSTTSRASSVASERSDPCESNMIIVEKGIRAPIDRNGMANKASSKELHENGNTETKGERESRALIVSKEAKTFERRLNGIQENGFREDNGVRRIVEKRLVQSRWPTQPPHLRGVQERFEKRTVEVRGCVPQKVIHNGHAVAREQLVKEVVENGLPSPEMNGPESKRRGVDHMPDREQNNDPKAAANGNVMTLRKQKRDINAEEFDDGPDRRALSNGGEKFTNRQPESPLWGEGSPDCSGSWRKGGMNPGEKEDRMLLSGSVDFSPWNTEKLPDIGTPQTVTRENSARIVIRSSPPSPIAEHTAAGNGSLTPKLQRANLPPHKLNKAFGQKKDAQSDGDCFIHLYPALVSTVSAKIKPNIMKKPKPVPRGNIDALWSQNGQDHVSLNSSAAQSLPPTRRSSPAGKLTPRRNKRRTASVLKNRSIKEQSHANHEETPSKSSDLDDNYLPVIMAKDPESRQRVIERRKKALQLDMEHRKRMARNLSRPSSARSSV